MAATDAETVRKEFSDAVNMTASELERWLERDESKAVGQKDGGGESTGHEMGRHIVDLATPWRYSLMNWGHDPLKK